VASYAIAQPAHFECELFPRQAFQVIIHDFRLWSLGRQRTTNSKRAWQVTSTTILPNSAPNELVKPFVHLLRRDRSLALHPPFREFRRHGAENARRHIQWQLTRLHAQQV
jgi:hypothetical protein